MAAFNQFFVRPRVLQCIPVTWDYSGDRAWSGITAGMTKSRPVASVRPEIVLVDQSTVWKMTVFCYSSPCSKQRLLWLRQRIRPSGTTPVRAWLLPGGEGRRNSVFGKGLHPRASLLGAMHHRCPAPSRISLAAITGSSPCKLPILLHSNEGDIYRGVSPILHSWWFHDLWQISLTCAVPSPIFSLKSGLPAAYPFVFTLSFSFAFSPFWS